MLLPALKGPGRVSWAHRLITWGNRLSLLPIGSIDLVTWTNVILEKSYFVILNLRKTHC